MLSLMLPGVESNNFCLNSDTNSVHFSGGEVPSTTVSARDHANISPARPPHQGTGPLLTSTPLVHPSGYNAGHLQLKNRVLGDLGSNNEISVSTGSNKYVRSDCDCDLISGVEGKVDAPLPLSDPRLASLPAADGSSDGSSPVGSCEAVAVTSTTPASGPYSSSSSTIRNGKLKRVSFGSSKGSMVETLVYDCDSVLPLKEEEVPLKEEGGDAEADAVCSNSSKQPTLQQDPAINRADAVPICSQGSASRLRVTYYESRRPLFVPGESCGPDLVEPELSSPSQSSSEPAAAPGAEITTATLHDMPTTYVVQTVEAGWENPFRPGGELSLEADDIVRAIQSGKPLASHQVPEALRSDETTVDLNGASDMVDHAPHTRTSPSSAVRLQSSAPNGSEAPLNGTVVSAQEPTESTVEPRHSVVAPEDPSHVHLKKRGKCCVIQ